MHSASRYHDISCGHRVHGHGGKCQFLHGHNYRVHFTCVSRRPFDPGGSDLDRVGRVIDFSVIKETLCQWLEDQWDHRFLIWEKDPLAHALINMDPSVVILPFNPTAENMAEYLVTCVAPYLLTDTGVRLSHVKIEETRKCWAAYEEAK